MSAANWGNQASFPLPLREGIGGGGAANPNNPTTNTTVSPTNALRRG
jgi:hypothetical protein